MTTPNSAQEPPSAAAALAAQRQRRRTALPSHDASRLEGLVAAELERIPDPSRRSALQRALVRPALQERSSLHVPGTFTCWVVARDADDRSELVYCRGPFGDRWGCLDVGGTDLGVDAQWFTKLDDAFIFGMWDGPLPTDYEVE